MNYCNGKLGCLYVLAQTVCKFLQLIPFWLSGSLLWLHGSVIAVSESALDLHGSAVDLGGSSTCLQKNKNTPHVTNYL